MSRSDLYFPTPIDLSGPVHLWRRRAAPITLGVAGRRVDGSFTIKSKLTPGEPELGFQDVLSIQGAPTGYEGFYIGKGTMRYLAEPTHWTCNAGGSGWEECRIHKDEMHRMLSFWANTRGLDFQDIERHHQDFTAYVKELRGGL